MALLELDAHTWRALALLLPDPTAFAACCKRASQVVGEDSFRLEWFSAHHRGLAPDRPWQYAALTWQLHRHASPEQIAAFMLRFHEWKQQQQHAMAAGQDNTAAAVLGAGPNAAAPTALAAAVRQAARARSMLQPLRHVEGYFTLPLECRLLPSTVRRARQLLAKGRALDALYHLCPGSAAVLFPYAAKSHNEGLMRQLLKHKEDIRQHFMVFPDHWFDGITGSMYIRHGFSCSYAALAGGNLPMLRLLLMCGGTLGKGSLASKWSGRLLLCYAARHSNAQCLQEVLLVREAHASYSRSYALVAPQHLQVAAARSDPWAAGVVQVLLQSLTPKQRKPSNMKPAYKAACSSGCMPVLDVLLGVAAAAPQQQLPVLLEAAAAAGNLQVWTQLLLQSGDSNHQQEPDDKKQQREGDSAAAAFPHLDWSCLTLQQLTSALHLVLPSREKELSYQPGTTQQQQWQAGEDACRVQMAVLLWQVLVVQQGREAALRQFLPAPVPLSTLGTHNPAVAAAAAAEAAAAAAGRCTAPAPGADLNSRLLFHYSANPSWLRHFHWWKMPAAAVLWLHQHQLIPKEQRQIAYVALKASTGIAMEAGDFQRALQLHNVVEGLDGGERHIGIMGIAPVVESSIGGHLRRACAAGDAAAVAQLERLACFARWVFLYLESALQRPMLLQTLLGSIRSRTVTAGTLAEELGLPWQLLTRLFQQHVAYRVTQSASLRTEQEQQQYREGLLRAASQTIAMAQDTGVTAMQLRSAGNAALVREMRSLEIDASALQQQAGSNEAAADGTAPGAGAATDAPNNAAAQQQEAPLAPLDPMQQLCNQLNAQLQQQNQTIAQANAGLQQVQQIVQQLQGAGAPGEEIAQIEAQAIANIPGAQQPAAAVNGQQEPELLPQEDYDSDAVVRRQLQARLDAGEHSIPVPKQVQLGPLPLWQQCVLEVVANHTGCLLDTVRHNGLAAYLTSGMVVADSAAAATAASHAERISPLQRLLGDEAFVTGPPVTPQPGRLPWGRLVAQAAVELRQPQLLAWALQPEQQQRLWGSAHNAPKAAVRDLSSKQKCSPISNALSRHPQQQLADMQQLQIYKQQQLPGRPMFARLAAETALLLLNITPNEEGLLSDWLQHGVHPGSSEANLVRAKAVLAAVVAAEQLPAGAQVMRRDCLKQVQRVGDVDLLALVVFWGHRL